MEWVKADVNMSEDLEKMVTGYDCRKKPMFGCPVYFVNDNMWTGVKAGIVFLRLSEKDRESIMLECDEITIFEPRPGFFMKEYVEIPDSKFADADFIRKWLGTSYDFVSRLPAKVKKQKKTQPGK